MAFRAWSAVLIVGLCGESAMAQEEMEPVEPLAVEDEGAEGSGEAEVAGPVGLDEVGVSAPDPQLRDPSLDQLVSELEGRPVADRVYPPRRAAGATPVRPGLDVLGPPPPTASVPAEGTFVVRRVGEVHRLGSGDLAFVADDPAAPGMVLVRSEVHSRLGDAMGPNGPMRVALTGEVLVYRGRVLLLPTAYSAAPEVELVDAGPEGEAAEVAGDARGESEAGVGDAADAEPDPGELDPRISALEAELRREQDRVRGLTPTLDLPGAADGGAAELGAESGGQVGAGAAGEAVAAEAGFVIRRRGRMVRLPDGWWGVAFDQDVEAREAPMPIVPCQALELMERTGHRLGEGWTFELTGRVVEAEGVRQVIPALVVSEPPGGLEARQ